MSPAALVRTRPLRLRALVVATALLGGCAPLAVAPEPVALPTGALDLTASVELALRNNPDARIAAQRALQAAEAVDLAESAWWPELTLGARASRTDQPSRVFGAILDQGAFAPGIDFNAPGTRTDVRPYAGVGWTLYDGGSRKARLRTAEAGRDAALAAERETRSMVALETARAWHQVHLANLAAELAEREAETLAGLAELARAELEVGEEVETNVRALELRRERALRTAETARDASRRARTALRVVLGLPADATLELTEPEPVAWPGPAELDAHLAEARFGRAELVRAQATIEAALGRLRAAEAGRLPHLGLGAELGFSDDRPNLTRSNWLFGASLVESVTEALRAPSRIRAAAADVLVAHEAGRGTLLAVERDVENAWLDARDAERSAELARSERENAADVLRRVESEHEVGAARRARLLGARLDAARASTAERVLELRRDLSRVALAHAVGAFPHETTEEQR